MVRAPPLEALIFDVDGTLAETEECHREAFNVAFSAAGLSWVWDRPLYAQLLKVTGGKERIAHYIETRGGTPALDPQRIQALHRHKTAQFATLIANGSLSLRPGVESLLMEARDAGIRLAVATTTTRENVTALLDATLGFDPFEIIIAGDDVSAKKPAPDAYNLALERLGLAADRCVAIEDTMNGFRSAMAAGLPCLVTMSEYGERDGFTGALAVVESLEDIAERPPGSIAGKAKRSIGLTEINAWREMLPVR
jgi:HAD superfamily hydrolase (TIGR01509 family)